jgi:hypothetical protein
MSVMDRSDLANTGLIQLCPRIELRRPSHPCYPGPRHRHIIYVGAQSSHINTVDSVIHSQSPPNATLYRWLLGIITCFDDCCPLDSSSMINVVLAYPGYPTIWPNGPIPKVSKCQRHRLGLPMFQNRSPDVTTCIV